MTAFCSFECPNCGMNFGSESVLNQHKMLIHHINNEKKLKTVPKLVRAWNVQNQVDKWRQKTIHLDHNYSKKADLKDSFGDHSYFKIIELDACSAFFDNHEEVHSFDLFL